MSKVLDSRAAAQRLQRARPVECIAILHDLRQQHLQLNSYHAAACLTACKNAERWPWTLQLLEELEGLQVEIDDVGCSCAIAACVKHWELALALLLHFARSGSGLLRSHGAALSACAKAKRWEEALGLLHWFEDLELQADVISYGAAINACEWPQALQLMDDMKAKSCEANDFCYSAAMKSLSAELWPLALQMLAELPQPDRRTLNAALTTLGRGRQWQICLDLLRWPAADRISYNIALDACSGNAWVWALVLLDELGEVDEVSLHAAISAMEEQGRWKEALALSWSHVQDPSSLRAAIATLGAAAQWQRALGLFRGHALDVYAGTAAVKACGNAGRWEQALQLVEDLRPVLNAFALTALLTACANAQRWQTALALINEDFPVRRNAFCFSATIAACAKGAQWQQAAELLLRMPEDLVEPNAICLNAALSACERSSQWQHAMQLSESSQIPLDAAGLHVLMCCAELGHWQLALELMARHEDVMSTAALDAAVMACCRAKRWQEALSLGRELLRSPVPGQRLEVLSALKALFEAGHPSLSQQLLHRLAQRIAEERSEFPQDLEQVLLAAAELETVARPQELLPSWIPRFDHRLVAPVTGRLVYQKEVALLRHVLQRCPVGDAAAVELAMDGFGEELGAVGGWAKFAGGSKADVLLSSVMGAAPSPASVLDVGAYCGGSALRLARHLPGAKVVALELDVVLAAVARVMLAFAGLQRVQLCTGHTRQLLPDFAKQSFGAVFMDLWGSQYTEALSLLQRHHLLAPHALLCADNVLRTAAGEFLWRVVNPKAPPGFRTLLLPVTEVVNQDEEDWMSVTVIHRGDSNVFEVPPAVRELQGNSERWRQRATNVGMDPEDRKSVV